MITDAWMCEQHFNVVEDQGGADFSNNDLVNIDKYSR